MPSDLPWDTIVGTLNQAESRDAARAALAEMLNGERTDARENAAAAAAEAGGLGIDGLAALLRLLRAHMTVGRVKGLAMEALDHPNEAVREEAAKGLATIPTDPEARGRLLVALRDSATRVRNVAIDVLPVLSAPSEAPTPDTRLAMFALPNDQERGEALQYLDRLEAAVKTLQDLGLDDAQHRIVDEIVLPIIRDLRTILNLEFPNEAGAEEGRRSAVVQSGALGGAVRSLAVASTAISGTANLDDAVENVRRLGEHLTPLAHQLLACISN